MATMTEEQLNQYEAYRRSSLNKKSMRRVSASYLLPLVALLEGSVSKPSVQARLGSSILKLAHLNLVSDPY